MFNCDDGRWAFSPNWIANGWRFREYRMSSFVDMSFSVNSAICRQYTETRKGDLAVGGNEIEISP